VEIGTSAAQAAAPGRQRRTQRVQSLPYVLLAPALTLIGVLLLWPTLNAIIMSFQNWDLFGDVKEHYFLGLRNYQYLFDNPAVSQSFMTTAIFTVGSVALEFVIGLAAALLVHPHFPGQRAARTILLIPWAIPFVPWTLALMLFYQRDLGVLNQWLMDLNLMSFPHDWLGNFGTALPTIIATRVWKSFPFVAVMMLAGLQPIPDEYYEAARIDGAANWQQLWHITLPLLKPVILASTLLLVIWHLKDFALVYVMTGGGPGGTTMLFVLFVWKSAFEAFRFGEAAAAAVVLLAVGTVFSVLYARMMTAEQKVG
jgi:multiple sugar transport system permease protein